MIKRFLKIDLDEAKPGMTLWESLADHKGVIFLPAGTLLTAPIITSLQRRGIDTVAVVNEAATAADLRAERERIEKHISVLFRHCAGGAASMELKKSVLEYRLGESK